MIPTQKYLWVVVILISLTVAGSFRISGTVSYAQDDDYTYTIVGGVDDPQTYDDQTVDGFTFTNFSYRSLYPDGMEFTVTITPPDGVTINTVTLFYTFPTGQGGRINAEPSAGPNEWIARPYAARGLPPWHEIDAFWGVRTDDLNVDSEPVHAVYYDATREWYRAVNDSVIVYWYDMPEDLGRYVLDGMASNRDRYLQGFGELLPYPVLAVIFPPGPAWNEYRGDSSIDDTQLGFTGTIISEAGSTIQRVRTLEPAQIRADCIWNPPNPTVEFQMQLAASTVTHETAHLYQQATGVSRGPTWWIEGQATFFEVFEEYPIHERLRTLAGMMDRPFPTLQGDGPSGGALTAAEDGCTHLLYDMGASFMNWLADSYGGIETYRAIVEEMRHGSNLPEALEAVTGKTFLELENEWRAFLGIPPVAPEQLDPALALTDPAEPFIAVGETVILPASPFSQSIYTEPSERSISNAVCFANTPVTVLRSGNDSITNWYEVDCMGLVGWMSQGQLLGTQ